MQTEERGYLVPAIERDGHLQRGSDHPNIKRLYTQPLDHLLPEWQKNADPRILDTGKPVRKKLVPNEGHRLAEQLLNQCGLAPVVSKARWVMPAPSKGTQKILVDTYNVPMLPEPSFIDMRLWRNEILTEKDARLVQRSGKHGGTASVHAQNDEKGIATRAAHHPLLLQNAHPTDCRKTVFLDSLLSRPPSQSPASE